MNEESYGVTWVCVCCFFMHHNGECCARDDHGGDGGDGGEPLSAIGEGFRLESGIGWEDHDSDCLTYIINELKDGFPELDWPSVPGDYECDCAQRTYSNWQCGGCGSWKAGERHGMTLFGPVSG